MTYKTKSTKNISSNVILLAELQENSKCLNDPENVAMLQALYSRSRDSVLTHVKKVEEKGSGNFISTYVVGYGHDSIAECGQTTIFFENLSLLAANHLQDFPLYSGIESSTRYLDFSNAPVFIPEFIYNIDDSNNLLEREVSSLYQSAIDYYHIVNNAVYDDLKTSDDPKLNLPDKSLRAAAFDVARGFLPSGVTTNMSLSGSLAKIKDWLIECCFSSLQEVRLLAFCALDKLATRYVSTFSDFRKRIDRLDQYMEYLQTCRVNYHTNLITSLYNQYGESTQHLLTGLDLPTLCTDMYKFIGVRLHNHEHECKALSTPVRQRLVFAQNTYRFGELFDLKFMLDFGSFRDLHRHRRGYCSLPTLSFNHGFSELYINKVPLSLRNTINTHLDFYIRSVDSLMARITNKTGAWNQTIKRCNPNSIRQYFILLGYNVPVQYICDLTQLCYIIELRSPNTVHFSLRGLVLCMYEFLLKELPEMAHFVNIDEDSLNMDCSGNIYNHVSRKRASQDIVESNTSGEKL